MVGGRRSPNGRYPRRALKRALAGKLSEEGADKGDSSGPDLRRKTNIGVSMA
jgi:hypothetical protein